MPPSAGSLPSSQEVPLLCSLLAPLASIRLSPHERIAAWPSRLSGDQQSDPAHGKVTDIQWMSEGVFLLFCFFSQGCWNPVQGPPLPKGVSLISKFLLFLLFVVSIMGHDHLLPCIVVCSFPCIWPHWLDCLLLKGPDIFSVFCDSLGF